MSDPRLTPAERRIAELLLCSQSPGAIARLLKRSPDTIKHHLTSMYRKLGLRGQVKLALTIHERRAALGVRCETCEHLEAMRESRRNLPYAKLVEENAFTLFVRPKD